MLLRFSNNIQSRIVGTCLHLKEDGLSGLTHAEGASNIFSVLVEEADSFWLEYCLKPSSSRAILIKKITLCENMWNSYHRRLRAYLAHLYSNSRWITQSLELTQEILDEFMVSLVLLNLKLDSLAKT